MTAERNSAYNRSYPAKASVVVNQRLFLSINFVLNGKGKDSNPLLHIHAIS